MRPRRPGCLPGALRCVSVITVKRRKQKSGSMTCFKSAAGPRQNRNIMASVFLKALQLTLANRRQAFAVITAFIYQYFK